MMLMGAFPGAKTSDSTSQVYESMLRDLDAAVTRTAVQRLIATSRFLPTISEIREAATAQQRGPRPTGLDAYEWFCRARRYYGWQRPPVMSERMSRAMAAGFGTWTDACSTDAVTEGVGRARFVAHYDELATRTRQDLVAGQALPAPSVEPRIVDCRPAKAALGAPTGPVRPKGPGRTENASAGQPGATTAVSRKTPAKPTPNQRRMSAAEIEAALGEVTP